MSMKLFVVPQEKGADVVGEQVREEYLEFHWNVFLTNHFILNYAVCLLLTKRDLEDFSKSNAAIKLARLLSLFMPFHPSAAGNNVP